MKGVWQWVWPSLSPPVLQEYQVGREQFKETKEARKKAAREYRVATNEYQPIAKKHEEQGKAVSDFVKNSQVCITVGSHLENIYT